MADFEDLRNITIVLFFVSFLVTSYRCFARYTKKLWWHDDSVALFSSLSFVIFLIGSIYISQESPSPWVRTAGTYILAVGFYTPLWGARVSIILTVVRITPWHTQRRILLWTAVFFVLLFAMLIAQLFWVCELTDAGWKEIPGAICRVPPVVPISLVVTTVISDAILVAAPLMVIRGVHIRALRFRLFSIFSMSIATTLASLAHALLVVIKPGVWEAIFGGVCVAVAVIVCNMSVIIPAVLRALGVGDPFMREDTVDPNFSTIEMARMTSTRIELGLPTTRGTAITDSDESEGTVGAVTSIQQHPVNFCAKDDRKRQLTTQTSDASLRNSTSTTTKVVPLADESGDADSLVQVGGLPGKEQPDIEVDVEDKDGRSNNM